MIVSIIVVGLVAYRLWRLLAVDTLLEPVSRWISGRGRWGHKFTHKFLSCPWCSGFWLAGLVSLVWHQGVSSEFVWVWVGSSVIVGLIGERS